MSRVINGFVLFVALSVVLTRPAHAYLDPGTASMLLQGILGGIAAAGAVISMNYQRVKFFVTSKFGKNGKAKV
jgi:hypothetical protein